MQLYVIVSDDRIVELGPFTEIRVIEWGVDMWGVVIDSDSDRSVLYMGNESDARGFMSTFVYKFAGLEREGDIGIIDMRE